MKLIYRAMHLTPVRIDDRNKLGILTQCSYHSEWPQVSSA